MNGFLSLGVDVILVSCCAEWSVSSLVFARRSSVSRARRSYFPPISGRGFGQISLNLWNPFDLPGGPSSQTEAEKVRGLQVEINNGRLAQLGLLSLLSQSVTPGSVPALDGFANFPQYAGNVMIPFSNDFSF